MVEMISEHDLDQLRRHARAGGDVLQLADELGYAVDEDFVFELLLNLIPISDERITTTTMKLEPRDAENPNIGMIIRDKVHDLYPEESEGFLIALAHSYKGREIKRIQDFNPGHVTKRIKLPRYIRTLVRGIGLIGAHSIEEIENFKLSEHDERKKQRIKLSYRTERDRTRLASYEKV